MVKLDRSIPLLEETLAFQKKVLGEHHHDTLHTMAILGVNYGTLVSWTSRVTPREALGKCKQNLRTEHPTTLFCMDNLGRAYMASGGGTRACGCLRKQSTCTRTGTVPGHHT